MTGRRGSSAWMRSSRSSPDPSGSWRSSTITSGRSCSTSRHPSATVTAVSTSVSGDANTRRNEWQMIGSSSTTSNFGIRVLRRGDGGGEARAPPGAGGRGGGGPRGPRPPAGGPPGPGPPPPGPGGGVGGGGGAAGGPRRPGGDRQAQARPRRFRGGERGEQPARDGRVDARPGVRHRPPNHTTRRARGTNLDRAAGRRRLDRVEEQVGDEGNELVAIDAGGRRAGRGGDAEGDGLRLGP